VREGAVQATAMLAELISNACRPRRPLKSPSHMRLLRRAVQLACFRPAPPCLPRIGN